MVLDTQHASINFTLNGQDWYITYQNTKSVCGVPDAARNAAIVWAVFSFALLVGLLFVCMCASKPKPLLAFRSHAAVIKTKTVYAHSVVQSVIKVASILWFLCFDVAIFLYSQISDLQVIIQVLHSSQQRYGYVLLSLLVLPYAFLILVLACFCAFWGCDSCSEPTCIWKFAYTLYGLLLTPVMFVIMEVGNVIDGLGIPIPAWLQDHSPDCSAYYWLNAAAESVLNALPQSVVQTTLYLRGNTSNGTGQYIDTWLFSYSIVASLLSVLKTVVNCFFEWRFSDKSALVYVMRLLSLQDVRLKHSVLSNP